MKKKKVENVEELVVAVVATAIDIVTEEVGVGPKLFLFGRRLL